MAYWLAWEEPRAVGDLVHVEKFFARNLEVYPRPELACWAGSEGNSRTPSMYADEKSDEVVVPEGSDEQRRATSCGGRGGKGLTQGEADSRPWFGH